MADFYVQDKFRQKFASIFHCAQSGIESAAELDQLSLTSLRESIMALILAEIEAQSPVTLNNINNCFNRVQKRLGCAFIDLMVKAVEFNQFIEFEFVIAVASNLSPDMVHKLFTEFKSALKGAPVPLRFLIICDEYVFCEASATSIALFERIHSPFYCSQVEACASDPDFVARLLRYLDKRVNIVCLANLKLNNPQERFIVTANKDNAHIGLIHYWVELTFKKETVPMFAKAKLEPDECQNLKELIFHILISQQKYDKDLPPMLEIISTQKQFATWNFSAHLSQELNQLLTKMDFTLLVDKVFERAANMKLVNLNWPNLLKIVSATMVYRPDLQKLMHATMENKLYRYIDYIENKQRRHEFIAMLILCRQMSLEPVGKFDSYGKLYVHYFATGKGIAPYANKLTNLLKYLTFIAPYEPAWTLRTHLAHPLPVPFNLRDKAADYYNLARTRLKDLREEERGSSSILFSALGDLDNATETDQEIDKVVAMFEANMCMELPPYVHELSVFKRSYFTGIFLPRLLFLQEVDPQESRSLLVQALRNAGKLS